MLKFIDIVINTRKYYIGCIYDDFECYISFENSNIVHVSKSNFRSIYYCDLFY